MFNDETEDNKTMIKNLVLIIVVLVVGFTLIFIYNKSNKTEEVLDTSIYLMITTVKSETINGTPKTTTIGEDKYYKDDLGKELNSNGMHFSIETFTNNKIVIQLNDNLIDIYKEALCPNQQCSIGTKISLDGSKSITLTDESDKYSYTIFFQKKK